MASAAFWAIGRAHVLTRSVRQIVCGLYFDKLRTGFEHPLVALGGL